MKKSMLAGQKALRKELVLLRKLSKRTPPRFPEKNRDVAWDGRAGGYSWRNIAITLIDPLAKGRGLDLP